MVMLLEDLALLVSTPSETVSSQQLNELLRNPESVRQAVDALSILAGVNHRVEGRKERLCVIVADVLKVLLGIRQRELPVRSQCVTDTMQ